jgi:hypothetical protein
VPVAAFITGFENATPESLQSFVTSNVEGKDEFPNFRGEISFQTFVVLDERSIRDGTALVHHRYEKMPEGSEEDEWDEEKLIREWKVWRVRFVAAWFLCANLWHSEDLLDSILENPRNAYVDSQGILHLAYFEQNVIELPDLEDRAPYGLVEEQHS